MTTTFEIDAEAEIRRLKATIATPEQALAIEAVAKKENR